MARLIGIVLLLIIPATSFARIVSKDETWSGKMAVDEMISIAPEATVTIKPGTELLFAKGAGIQLQGFLVANGGQDAPVIFGALDTKAGWQGITLISPDHPTTLSGLRVTGAAEAFTVQGSKLILSDSHISGGGKGIAAGAGAAIEIRRVAFTNLETGAVEANAGTIGSVVDCRIERVKEFGVMTGKKVTLDVSGNTVVGAKVGIVASTGGPPVENNVLTDCETGIGVSQADINTSIRGNRFNNCKRGVGCLQFASPEIAKNVFTGCEVGVDCFQASSPYIHKNRFASNRRAVNCVQMCNPVLFRNEFSGNEVGVYLHLSSYAVLHENNFERQKTAVELDNMSYDWEVRASSKPSRFRQAQNDALVKLGRAMPGKFKDDVQSEGFVNAKENYWGEEATKEIEAKGKEANISIFKDFYDVPTRTYEGWEGEFKQDKVNYEGWKKTRVPEAGP